MSLINGDDVIFGSPDMSEFCWPFEGYNKLDKFLTIVESNSDDFPKQKQQSIKTHLDSSCQEETDAEGTDLLNLISTSLDRFNDLLHTVNSPNENIDVASTTIHQRNLRQLTASTGSSDNFSNCLLTTSDWFDKESGSKHFNPGSMPSSTSTYLELPHIHNKLKNDDSEIHQKNCYPPGLPLLPEDLPTLTTSTHDSNNSRSQISSQFINQIENNDSQSLFSSSFPAPIRWRSKPGKLSASELDYISLDSGIGSENTADSLQTLWSRNNFIGNLPFNYQDYNEIKASEFGAINTTTSRYPTQLGVLTNPTNIPKHQLDEVWSSSFPTWSKPSTNTFGCQEACCSNTGDTLFQPTMSRLNLHCSHVTSNKPFQSVGVRHHQQQHFIGRRKAESFSHCSSRKMNQFTDISISSNESQSSRLNPLLASIQGPQLHKQHQSVKKLSTQDIQSGFQNYSGRHHQEQTLGNATQSYLNQEDHMTFGKNARPGVLTTEKGYFRKNMQTCQGSSGNSSDGSNSKPSLAKWRRACSFYLRGHCKKEDCEFAHDLTKVTCKFWELGECFKGTTCPFLHGYPPELIGPNEDLSIIAAVPIN